MCGVRQRKGRCEVSDNQRRTPETDAMAAQMIADMRAATNSDQYTDAVKKNVTTILHALRNMERERDEAREQANDWHDMEAVATDMYRNRATRLSRMVRIALRWRRESEAAYGLSKRFQRAASQLTYDFIKRRRRQTLIALRYRRERDEALAALAKAEKAESLISSIAEWQRKTFPHGTPASCMAHLARECGELAHALGNGLADETAEEAADCLLLLVGIADRSGFDLLQAAEVKLEKNKRRIWGEPDDEGVVEHIDADKAGKGEG